MMRVSSVAYDDTVVMGDYNRGLCSVFLMSWDLYWIFL